jgi:DNA replication licensing factor MCM4
LLGARVRQVRLQEAPEHIPEGETPQTCSMCAWEGLVDTARPGDRVEVTGVYRAVPLRVNPKMRTVRKIYKTCAAFARAPGARRELRTDGSARVLDGSSQVRRHRPRAQARQVEAPRG